MGFRGGPDSGGGRGSFRGNRDSGGFRGRGGFRGGRGGSFGGFDQGPPEQVVEIGEMMHACQEDLVCNLTNEKIPYFNAPMYLENKEQIGKVDEIFGPIKNSMFSVKLSDNLKSKSFKSGLKLFIDPAKLLPLERFLNGGSAPRGRGGGRGGDRGGRGGFGRGGGRGFGRGGGGSFRGGDRGGFRGGDRGGFGRGGFGRGGGDRCNFGRGGFGRGGAGGGFKRDFNSSGHNDSGGGAKKLKFES